MTWDDLMWLRYEVTLCNLNLRRPVWLRSEISKMFWCNNFMTWHVWDDVMWLRSEMTLWLWSDLIWLKSRTTWCDLDLRWLNMTRSEIWYDLNPGWRCDLDLELLNMTCLLQMTRYDLTTCVATEWYVSFSLVDWVPGEMATDLWVDWGWQTTQVQWCRIREGQSEADTRVRLTITLCC